MGSELEILIRKKKRFQDKNIRGHSLLYVTFVTSKQLSENPSALIISRQTCYAASTVLYKYRLQSMNFVTILFFFGN